MPNSLVSNQEDLYADFIHCWQQQKFKLQGVKITVHSQAQDIAAVRSALSVGLIEAANGRQIPFSRLQGLDAYKK